MPKPANIDIDELRDLYVVQGLTKFAISKRINFSPQTVDTYILRHKLQDERVLYLQKTAERQEQTVNALLNQQEKSKESQQESGVQEYQPDPTGERSEIIVAQPHPIVVAPEIEDDPSAFGRLTRRQQIFVIHFVKCRKQMTHEQIGESMPGGSVVNKTVSDWLNLPDIQEAILDLVRQEWKFQGELKLFDRFDDLIETGKERPEDRKLLADIYGLTNGSTINLNFNVQTKSPNLKGRFTA